MTITSYPFADQSTSEAQFRKLFREIQGVAATVLGGPGSGQLAVTANGSGMAVTVALGGAIVQAFYFDSDSNASVSIAGASSVARTDTIALRLTPSAPGAPGSVSLVSIRGNITTGAAPSLVQTDTGTYEYPLANVLVPANATSIPAANVTDRRTFIINQSNIDTGWQDIPAGTGMTASSPIQWRNKGGIVYLRGVVGPTSGNFAATTEYPLLGGTAGLPALARPFGQSSRQPTVSGAGFAQLITFGTDGSVKIFNGSSAAGNTVIGHSYPNS